MVRNSPVSFILSSIIQHYQAESIIVGIVYFDIVWYNLVQISPLLSSLAT